MVLALSAGEGVTKFLGLEDDGTTAAYNSHIILGGGFKYFLCSSLFGEDYHFD